MDLIKTFEQIKMKRQEMLDLTIKLADINSGSFNVDGVNEVGSVLIEQFSGLDCQIAKMPVTPMKLIDVRGEEIQKPLGDVIRLWKRPDAVSKVLMIGHMDTVFQKDHKFQSSRVISDKILHGPGVTDMKGGIVVMLNALRAFEKTAGVDKLGWEVILTPDEEIGSPGSTEILESRAKKHKIGFVFEPAVNEHGTLAGARKGSGKFTLVMRGKSAHAGRDFQKGRNAICKMAEIISEINRLNGQRAGVTINVGFIQGGESVNVIPDCCICRLDVRIPNNFDADWVLANLDAIVHAVNSEQEYKMELHGKFGRRPKSLDSANLKLYEAVRKVGRSMGFNLSWEDTGGCCDGNNLAASGLPNIDTLGVRGGNIHSSEEFMIIDSLVERTQLLTGILNSINNNG